MKVDIRKTEEALEPYAVIDCREISAEVLSAAETLSRAGDVITARVCPQSRFAFGRSVKSLLIQNQKGITRGG